MYFLIYTSYAHHTNEQELKALLHQAQEKNKKKSITGMLLYLNGIYIQLLEGQQKDVQLLYEKILRDSRHEEIVLLKEDTIEKRFYADWSMGFKTISADELNTEENYRCLNPLNKQNADAVLKVFKLLSTDSVKHETL
ncbi:MAG: BLUF domain-containing protein [Sphingobacteriaceae bacterium]|nr:MAG: BLUF domain-containing protein [Sphingobacteriaceae bacterium]